MQSGVVSAVGGPQGLPLLAESVRQPREPTSAVGFPCGGGVQVPVRGPGRKPAHSKSGNDGNGSPQTLPVFLFLEKVSGDPLLPLQGPPTCPVSVSWKAARLPWGSHKAKTAEWPPRQHSVTALALVERRPAQLPFWTQAEGAAKRSEVVRASGNEVFALLGRTGTGQCLVAALPSPKLVSLAPPSPTALTPPASPNPALAVLVVTATATFRPRSAVGGALVLSPLPVRLRRSLRLRAPLLFASIRSAADAPGPPKHRVASRGERQYRRTASRPRSGTPATRGHLGPDLGPPSSPDAITSWSPRIAPMI
jgi:hypothetical protein